MDRILGGPAAALTAVTLLAGAGARASGWAARAAVAIARSWPEGRRIVLADLDFAGPSLHSALGAVNDEGVVDLVDYGVSLGHVLQVVDDGALDLIAAGIYAPDPAATLAAPAWDAILREMDTRRATLLAFVPAGADAGPFIERTGAVIVLAEDGEWRDVLAEVARPYGVLAVLTPPGAAAESVPGPLPEAAPAAAETAAGDVPAETPRAPAPDAGGGRLSDAEFERIRLPTDRASRDSLIADLRDRQRAARMSAPADPMPAPRLPAAGDFAAAALPSGPGDAAVEMRLESAADALPADVLDGSHLVVRSTFTPYRRRSFGKPLTWTLVVVALVSTIAGAWRFLEQRLQERERQEQAPPPAPVVVTPPQPQALPYAVAVEAHRDLATALGRVDALAAAAPALQFHVAPLELEGTLFYHVMAGPVADSAAALALRDTLVARGHKTAAAPSDVRLTPLAFLIGEYGAQAAADQQLDELRRLDVPGYRVTADAADGQPLHRVYVGGFSAAAEADVIRQLLRAAGIRDSLVTRTGSSTQ